MDIAPVGTITIKRTCGDVPCGQCQPCLHRAKLHAASYADRVAEAEEDDPKAVLTELLKCLGLL